MKLAEWARRNGVHPQAAYRWFRECGVSSADQRPNLDRQVARVTEWPTGRGLTVGRVATAVGLALNGKRKKFLALLADPAVTTVVVEHRDRFAAVDAIVEGVS